MHFVRVQSSVVDPDSNFSFGVDPNCDFSSDADPDRDFYLIRMRIRIRLFTMMRIRIRIQILASKKRLKPLKKCSNRLIFHTFRIQLITLVRIKMRIRILNFIWCGSGFLFDADSDPDADPGDQNDADPFGSGFTTLVQRVGYMQWDRTVSVFMGQDNLRLSLIVNSGKGGLLTVDAQSTV